MMYSNDPDVIIVGAGVAGLAAAIAMARQGMKTILLEQNPQIGLKIRGEVINKIDPVFDMVFGSQLPEELIDNVYEDAHYYSPSCQNVAKRVFKTPKVNINYRSFIEELARIAIKNGVDVILNATVKQLIKKGQEIAGVEFERFGVNYRLEAKLILGADGHGSALRGLAGLPSPKNLQVMLKGMAESVKCNAKRLDFYLLADPPAVLWIFPKSSDRAEVGCTLWSPHAPRQDKEALLETWNKNLKNHPLFSKAMTRARFLYFDFDGLPLGGPQKKHYRSNLFLIGDAAGHVTAVGGSGIISSMTVGTIVGNRFGTILKEAGKISEDDLSQCSATIKQSEIGRKLASERKTAKMMRDILYKVLKTPEEIDASWDKLKGPIEDR